MSLFDENAAILRDMEADGSDLGPSRLIDFSLIFADRASAEAVALEAEGKGYSSVVRHVEEPEEPWDKMPWDVTLSKVMVPTCENITHAEESLDNLARSHGGRTDGWGFLRV